MQPEPPTVSIDETVRKRFESAWQTVAADGALWIVDSYNNRVVRIEK